jgi:cysteinyl-tRNA synthetase
VRNITDVGHLLGEDNEGEDKISKRARLEKLEPMEVVQKYANDFHTVMQTFNVLPPSIEPTATGHLLEQIQMTEELLKQGYAYEVNGSVYFDVVKYAQKYRYGELSGRVIDELQSNTRTLEGQEEKRKPLDFALWKKASDEHLMQWDSPWGKGFPGWHLECSVMSTKYLGKTFDIHGGGMDLKFPHHECEIAQNNGSYNQPGARYWLHTNMLTVNGQKMSKSLGNSFLPTELLSGDHPLLERGYSPMTVRFFMLQSHYASTLDISVEALNSASKGYLKLMNGVRLLNELHYNDEDVQINEKAKKQVDQLCDNCESAMNDDFNTALTIGHLFNLIKKVHTIHTGQLKPAEIGKDSFENMRSTINSMVFDVLGLSEEKLEAQDELLALSIQLYGEAKESKDYDKVDEIRAALKKAGIVLKDTKQGIEWAYEER